MRCLMRERPRWTTLSLCFAAALLLFTGCSTPPSPETTKESLVEVTEEPAPTDEDSPFNAEIHPDPIVEPLECDRYLVITARGTGEPKRKQLLAKVARAISDARPDDVRWADLKYPADTDVNLGGEEGARRLIDTLNVQTQACPDQEFVLLGYSQGALVVGDALSGSEFRLVGQDVGEITPEARDRIIAVVFYGNPRFVGLEPYNVGSFNPNVNGILPRPEGSLEDYEDRLRDYCVATDFVCQSSFNLNDDGHVSYYINGMQQDGAAFVITKLDPIEDVIPDESAGDDQSVNPDESTGDAQAGTDSN